MKRADAYTKLDSMLENKNLLKHCLAVEAALKAYAEYFDVPENEREDWAVAGLIHDADWEKFPDQHPQVIVEWLKENGADDDIINAVEAHGFAFNIEAKTQMAKILRAVDELTGLITATALVRESKKLSEVTVESVQKKWNNAGFAKGVNREDIVRGAAEIGVPLEKHIEIVLGAMQGISDELGL
jgi:predicted hydrolase (HD superfamily)